jgi:hypothetical protein
MKRKKIDADYTGPLAAPIYQPLKSAGLLGNIDDLLGNSAEPENDSGTESAREAAWERALEQIKEKVPLLFAHFDIDPEDEHCWMRLAWGLALTHVPGMQIILQSPPKRGPKKKWFKLGDVLVADVQAITLTGCTVREAIKRLQKDRNGRWHEYTATSLEARHREAKARQRDRRLLLAALLESPPWPGGLPPWPGGLPDLDQSGFEAKGAGPTDELVGPLEHPNPSDKIDAA